VELLRMEQRGGGGRYDEDPPGIQSSEVQIQLLQNNMANMQQVRCLCICQDLNIYIYIYIYIYNTYTGLSQKIRIL